MEPDEIEIAQLLETPVVGTAGQRRKQFTLVLNESPTATSLAKTRGRERCEHS